MGLPTLINKFISMRSYNSWLKEHPCALDRFKDMMRMAKGKKIVLFLDYDGTLSPIVNDPDVAFMTEKMRSVVYEVGCCFPTSIISGRSREKVYEFVQVDNIYYAGSHGMDIMAPLQPLSVLRGSQKYPYPITTRAAAIDSKLSDILVIHQPAQHFLPEIKQIHKSLLERTSSIEGVKIEDNNFCLSVHFRNVMEQDLGLLEEEVNSVLEEYPHFQMTSGKMVLEIRPPIDWDKGRAVEYLLDNLGFSASDEVLPIYIGDDRTDEDAFKVIERMGDGYSIIVTSVPRDTRATYSLYDTIQVMSFLEQLARWKNNAYV